MTEKIFAPKGAEEIKAEILAETGMDYEANKEIVDKLVERGVKDEDFKASLHADKTKHLGAKEAYAEKLKQAGIDPETGQKVVEPKGTTKPAQSLKNQILENRALNDVHEDDVEEIADYAERKGLTLHEAKKSPVIQAFLKTQEENRTSAAVANTSKRGARKDGGEDALANFEDNFKKGNLSVEDDDVAAVVAAQIAERKRRAKIGV